ncbi:hypothetical protein [Nocardioides daejeonensis]|uniref:hypothetical protein n=1 Tax=Nocardioides daejeonensis TaxID=1046556 RepID=UPI000D74BE3F|nr:hypothetical protein [Nocardioides daejeonensis]
MPTSPDPAPGAGAFEQRLERWTRESEALRAGSDAALDPEEAALLRYRRSTTGATPLPHPLISPERYDDLTRQQRRAALLMAVLLLLAPVLVVLGLVVDPTALQAAILVLLAPTLVGAAGAGRRIVVLGRRRQVTLRGGLADAWRDWMAARAEVEAIDHAAQARAALGANEPRMESLILALAEVGTRPGQETDVHTASREWIYRSAAKAVALAAAERQVEAASVRELESTTLQLAPSGDADALDHALRAARELSLDEHDEK